MIQKPLQQQSVNVPAQQQSQQQAQAQNQALSNQVSQNSNPTKPAVPQQVQPVIKTEPVAVKTEDDIDVNWLYVCDWRGCQR